MLPCVIFKKLQTCNRKALKMSFVTVFRELNLLTFLQWSNFPECMKCSDTSQNKNTLAFKSQLSWWFILCSQFLPSTTKRLQRILFQNIASPHISQTSCWNSYLTWHSAFSLQQNLTHLFIVHYIPPGRLQRKCGINKLPGNTWEITFIISMTLN